MAGVTVMIHARNNMSRRLTCKMDVTIVTTPKRFKVAPKPTKGKAKRKGGTSYGQAGKAKDGGPRVRRGTKKGDGYCARSLGIKKGIKDKKKRNDPNSANNRSRKAWGCVGAKSYSAPKKRK